MIDVKKILVPVDFSEPSKKAVNYGTSLALQFNARLILAHIVPSHAGFVYTFPTESFAFDKDQASYARSMLPTMVAEEYHERVNLMTIVKVGVVKDELLAIIKDENIGLVVMGTNGRNTFERLLLGSVTERMLRKLHVPILTVSHLDPTMELQSTEPVPLRKILYATDLSDGSEVGMKFSLELSQRTGARLTVLHVLDPIQPYWGDMGTFIVTESEDRGHDALTRLRLSIPEIGSQGVDLKPMMTEGDPAREILRVANEEKMNLIVLNLEGKTLVERAVLGATAERVIRAAHMPVLSIPVTAKVVSPTRESAPTAA
jgi:nucleotide-binding universal stress UspA family protein